MKRLVLVLALALVLVGSASAEPLATYEHTFVFSSGSGSGSGSVVQPIGSYSYGNVGFSQTVFDPVTNLDYYPYLESPIYCTDAVYLGYTWSSVGPWKNGQRLEQYTSEDNSLDISSYVGSDMLQYTYARAKFITDKKNAGVTYDSNDAVTSAFCTMLDSLIQELSTSNPGSYVIVSPFYNNPGFVYIYVLPYGSSVSPSGFAVDMVSEVQKPWFDLFGMRGLTASFTPSNPDEDYYILFAGSDSWVGQNPDKWIWTRVHGSANKYKIIFSGNSYTWFVKYNDEIQQFSFTFTGEEGVVPPVIVPDPEPEPPVTPPIIDTPGEADPPDYPSIPDIYSPDLRVDFTSGFDDYANMTIYQDVRRMIDGFTSSIAPNIETTQFYQILQEVIAYLQLVMEQLREKYAVPIYNILASVSSFVPPICWLAVNIALIFGMFRFVVHIVTGPISSAIRERF